MLTIVIELIINGLLLGGIYALISKGCRPSEQMSGNLEFREKKGGGVGQVKPRESEFQTKSSSKS